MAQPLVVTTSYRGVFFGYGEPCRGTELRLERARMCVYWDATMRGVVGLASMGPGPLCRIGPAAPAITLTGVTAIMECTAEAVEAWESEPWSQS